MILLRIVMTQEDCRNIAIENNLWYNEKQVNFNIERERK